VAAHRGVDGVSQDFPQQQVRVTSDDVKRRRARSIAIAVVLGLLVVLFYALTVVKLGPQVLSRSM